MKKLLYIGIFTAFTISCGENQETFENTADSLTHNAESVAEEGAENITEYNDALLAETTLLQIEFSKINDLDEQDVPEEEFILEANKSIESIHNIQETLNNIVPYGAGGEDFLQAVKDFAITSETYIKLYLEYSAIMPIPDDELTEEQINKYLEDFLPIDDAYSEAFNNISSKQEIFAQKNGAYVEEEASYNAEAIYQNSKEK